MEGLVIVTDDHGSSPQPSTNSTSTTTTPEPEAEPVLVPSATFSTNKQVYGWNEQIIISGIVSDYNTDGRDRVILKVNHNGNNITIQQSDLNSAGGFSFDFITRQDEGTLTLKVSVELFDHLRPDDLNYNCAVSNKNEKVKLFFQKELSQLSTIENDQAKKVFQGNIKEKEIQAFTLDEILNRDKYRNVKIDFLNIDVEGADFKVLDGLSFQKFNPELICVEIHDKEIKESKTYNFLKDKNYQLIWSGVFSHLFSLKKKI